MISNTVVRNRFLVLPTSNQERQFDEFRAAVAKMIRHEEEQDFFFSKVVQYIATICQRKGHRGVLFLVDDVEKMFEALRSGNTGFDLMSWSIEDINCAIDKIKFSGRLVPRVFSIVDYQAIEDIEESTDDSPSVFNVPLQPVNFTQLPEYAAILKTTAPGRGILNSTWQTALRFCCGHPHFLEHVLAFYFGKKSQKEKNNVGLREIYERLKSTEVLQTHFQNLSFDVVKSPILKESVYTPNKDPVSQRKSQSFSKQCSTGAILNGMDTCFTPTLSPFQIWTLAESKNCDPKLQALLLHMLFLDGDCNKPATLASLFAYHPAVAQGLRYPERENESKNRISIHFLLPWDNVRRIQIKDPNSTDWSVKTATKPFAKMTKSTIDEHTIYIAARMGQECDLLFKATTKEEKRAYIGVITSHSKDSPLPQTTADQITGKWAKFNALINRIDSDAQQVLVFMPEQEYQADVKNFISKQWTTGAQEVLKKLNEAGCREHIVLSTDRELRRHFGETVYSILAPIRQEDVDMKHAKFWMKLKAEQ